MFYNSLHMKLRVVMKTGSSVEVTVGAFDE